MPEPELHHHHRVVKQFLRSLDELLGSPLSDETRTAQAHQKWSRLLDAQFREFSVDVYDEVKRRMEQPQQPPVSTSPLLPYTRHQARLSLALLSPHRFRDLVGDYSHELECRGLHQLPSVST